MGIIDGILTKLFGNKSERDIKEIMPYVLAANAEYEKLAGLTNDQLRQQSLELQQIIQDRINPENQQIADLRQQIEQEQDIEKKEDLYNQIDKVEEAIDVKIADVLDELLPRAFAIIKDTARRFKESKEIEVTATQMDRDIAAIRDSVEIRGDKAIWFNTWTAGGSPITWDMVHYDVQLIGGVALHKGKIAEMATGEGKTLVATLPVFLNALTHRGVHMVTVNDYLAKRDAEWMGYEEVIAALPSLYGIKVSPDACAISITAVFSLIKYLAVIGENNGLEHSFSLNVYAPVEYMASNVPSPPSAIGIDVI